MIALEVRDLIVEVGGKIVVEGLSFDLRPGDKVGVVGRNGAGKTSTMKVLTGEAEPAGGSVLRRGSVGYLRQDPRQHRAEDDDLALEHVLAARGLVELSRSVEKARIALSESHDERSIRRFSRLEEEYTLLGGYQAESEAKTIVAGLGLPHDRLDLPVKHLSGGERRRLELARILFAGSDLLLLDEPTNHLDVDAKTWLMRFLAHVPRRAARDQPRPRAARRVDHARAAPRRRRAHRIQGHLLAVPRRARGRRGAAAPSVATRQAAEIKRLSTLADSMRGQTAKRARKAKIARHARRPSSMAQAR